MSVVPSPPCPVSGCAVCAAAEGAHIGASVAVRACVAFLVQEISQVLARPGLPAHSVQTLNRVDAAFGCLDALLRAGAEVPAEWSVVSSADPWAREEVTDLYDLVSEALRETGDVMVCRQALRTAGAGWELLYQALCAGAPLPEPW